jgi:hypothetical protein
MYFKDVVYQVMFDVYGKVFQFLIASIIDPFANVHYLAYSPSYRKMHRLSCSKK